MFDAYLHLVGRLADSDWTGSAQAQLPPLQAQTRLRVNDTAEPQDETLLDVPFFRHAACAPGAPAVLGASGEVLSYGELAERPLGVAGKLRDQGVVPGTGSRSACPRDRTRSWPCSGCSPPARRTYRWASTSPPRAGTASSPPPESAWCSTMWRTPLHIADTREQAVAELRETMPGWPADGLAGYHFVRVLLPVVSPDEPCSGDSSC